MGSDKIKQEVERISSEAIEFFRQIVRIPSLSGKEDGVVEAVEGRMRQLGYDEVFIDSFGNVVGRVGDGDLKLCFDAHVDTVGEGQASLWAIPPFSATIKNGNVHGRGTADQKGGMAAAVYAAAVARKAGFLKGVAVYVVGSVFEEDCDGLCWQYLIRSKTLVPDAVVITEPTNLNVHRGHRGRIEIQIGVKGTSCHGSMPERGVNAIYRMVPVIKRIERLSSELKPAGFLGKGSVTVAEVSSQSPSLCAVPDYCSIYLDRRLTEGEDEAKVIDELKEIGRAEGVELEIEVPVFNKPTWKGYVMKTRKFYPPWVIEESHPLVRVALESYRQFFGRATEAGKWLFSTNGTATMGMFSIPTVGFGPGDERLAHSPMEKCPVNHIIDSIGYYVTLIKNIGENGL